MQNNNSNNYPQEYKIDLIKLFNFFNNSKKLIITITLVITTLGAIYSSQIKVSQYQSTALIEIGNYKAHNLGSDFFEIKLIEPIFTLIKEINSQFIHQKKLTDYEGGYLQLVNLEDRLLRIIYISPLPEKNEEVLNKLVIFIENRHLEMQTINTERIKNQFDALSNLSTNKLEERIHDITKELLELEFLMKHNPTYTKVVGEIVTDLVNPKIRFYIFLSFVLGLFLSIVMATINHFLKVFKEEQV